MNKFLDEVWGKWYSIPIVFIISILVGVTIISGMYPVFSDTITNKNRTYLEPSGKTYIFIVVVLVCILGLNLWNFVFVYRKNHIKKARRNKTGIMIHIDTNNNHIYKETVSKFGYEFNSNLIDDFEDVYVPFGVPPIGYKSEEILSFLKRKRCLLYLDIHIDTDLDDNSYVYDMKINGTIIHATYGKEIEREFQKIFSEKIHKFGNVIFQSKEMTKKLRVTA